MSDADAPTLGETVAPVDERLQAFDWWPIVKKEFADTIRSYVVIVLSVAFIAFFALPVALAYVLEIGQLAQAQGQEITSNAIIGGTARMASAIVPLIAIVVGYASIAGERDSGSLKLLLSLPYSRGDVLVGKLVGRSAVVAVPLAIGLVTTIIVLALTAVTLELGGFVWFSLMTLVLAVVFVGFAVGVSAAASTGRRAMIATVGVFVYFYALWNSAARGTGSLLRDHTDVEALTTVKIELAMKLLNPTQAYQTLVTSLTGADEHIARAQMFQGLRGQIIAQELQGSVPFYLSDAAAFGALLLWLVVPLLIGYRVFGATDL